MAVTTTETYVFVVRAKMETVHMTTTVTSVTTMKIAMMTQRKCGKDSVNILRNKNKLRTKSVPIETRLIEQRSKIYKALLKTSLCENPSEYTTLLYELIDNYIDLVRLKLAQKTLNL